MNSYNIIGVTPNASLAELQQAYRKAAMKLHPDRGGDVTAFQQLSNAYKELSSNFKNKLEEYDDDYFEFEEFNDDISISVPITLQQSYIGGELEISYELLSGVKQSIILIIPKGVNHNEVIRYQQLGDNSIPYVDRGDLLVQFYVKDNQYYARSNDDLCSILTINAFEAMIGTTKKITGLDDKEYTIIIKPGIIPNQKIQIKEKGFYNITCKTTGNYVIIIEIQIPEVTDPLLKKQLLKIEKKLRS